MFAGYCAFLQLYATQPLLPLLTQVFRASKVAVSMTVTVGGLGIALGAPVAGYLADRLGRRRVIVWSAFCVALSALATSTASSLAMLIFWRFLQGIFTPGIFAVTIAYINDEWAGSGASRTMSSYVSGTVLGGFSSRMLSGLIAAHLDFHWVFVILGAMNLAGAVVLSLWLPPERNPHHVIHSRGSWLRAVRGHLRNRRLVATFTVGFCVLFSLVGTFTYVTFYLAEPPFHLMPAALGSVFVVYLVGAAIMPITSRAIEKFGSRITLAGAITAGVGGISLTLIHSLWMVALGLTICCSGVFLAQASASSFIGVAARENRALAVGMYASCYHAGGSFGAAVPGYFWELGGWPACVAFIACVQILTVSLAILFWQDHRISPSEWTPAVHP